MVVDVWPSHHWERELNNKEEIGRIVKGDGEARQWTRGEDPKEGWISPDYRGYRDHTQTTSYLQKTSCSIEARKPTGAEKKDEWVLEAISLTA